MRPHTIDLIIQQGDSFSFAFRLLLDDKVTGRDLTGWSGKSQIRNVPADEPGSTVIASFTPVFLNQDAADTRGWVFFTLTPAQTTALTQGGYYDAQVQNTAEGVAPTERLTVQRGTVTLEKEYTR